MSGAIAFDLDGLKALVDKIPMWPILASCSSFSSEHAYSWEENRQEYLAAGKGFWEQLGRALPATTPGHAFNLMMSQPLGSLPIHDLDHPAERELRSKIMASFIRARAATQ